MPYRAYAALQDADVRASAVERWPEDAIDVAVEEVPDGLGRSSMRSTRSSRSIAGFSPFLCARVV